MFTASTQAPLLLQNPLPLTHYEILELPLPRRLLGDPSQSQSPTQTPLNKESLRVAYRRALLLHHPDKANTATATTTTGEQTPASGGSSEGEATTQHEARDSKSTTASAAAVNLNSTMKTPISIDAIVTAYTTLADPVARAAYDAQLLSSASSSAGSTIPPATAGGGATHVGVETWDLEEMEFDEKSRLWKRRCWRCCDLEGFIISEEELEGEMALRDENESGRGEVLVGCRGCSLYVKVVFQVVEVDEEEG